MQVERLPRTGDGMKIVITADDGSKHRFHIWQDNAGGWQGGEAAAIEEVERRIRGEPRRIGIDGVA